jgi:hypothetical protein
MRGHHKTSDWKGGRSIKWCVMQGACSAQHAAVAHSGTGGRRRRSTLKAVTRNRKTGCRTSIPTGWPALPLPLPVHPVLFLRWCTGLVAIHYKAWQGGCFYAAADIGRHSRRLPTATTAHCQQPQAGAWSRMRGIWHLAFESVRAIYKPIYGGVK